MISGVLSGDVDHGCRKPVRTVIITGGNAGLGYACAVSLLAASDGPPWRVILACRNPELAQSAVERLTRLVGAADRVEAMSLDLASLKSVRAFANAVAIKVGAGEFGPLDALVCNAGVQSGAERTFTSDGFETTFGVNHLGHFLLVNLLIPILATQARIAVVSSGAHDSAKNYGVPPPAWNEPEELSRGKLGPTATKMGAFAYGQQLYTTSKLANVYFSYSLARRLPSMGVNAFDPGLMPGTGLARNAPAPIRYIFTNILPYLNPLLRLILSPNVHTTEESGTALAQMVTGAALAGRTGKYFEGATEISSSLESYSTDRAEALSVASERLTAQSKATIEDKGL